MVTMELVYQIQKRHFGGGDHIKAYALILQIKLLHSDISPCDNMPTGSFSPLSLVMNFNSVPSNDTNFLCLAVFLGNHALGFMTILC